MFGDETCMTHSSRLTSYQRYWMGLKSGVHAEKQFVYEPDFGSFFMLKQERAFPKVLEADN